MDHKLRIPVRLDIGRSSAVIAVGDRFAAQSYWALLPVIPRVNCLVVSRTVIVDLPNALHANRAASEAPGNSMKLDSRHDELGAVVLRFPDVDSACEEPMNPPSSQRLVAAS